MRNLNKYNVLTYKLAKIQMVDYEYNSKEMSKSVVSIERVKSMMLCLSILTRGGFSQQ
jgi:hypothetical protein